MRQRVGLALMSAATALAVFADARRGHAGEEPWCIIYGGSQGAIEDCGMRNFEMCRQEAVAGNRGSCFPNPRWHAEWPQHYRYTGHRRG